MRKARVGEYLPSGSRSTIPLASYSASVLMTVSTLSLRRSESSSGLAGEAMSADITGPHSTGATVGLILATP